MTARARVLIAGCGYVGSRAATMLCERGDEVFAARRSASWRHPSATTVSIDLLDGDLDALPPDLDAVVWAVSPTPDAEGYRRAYVDGPTRLLQHLEQRGDPLRRAVLVGSTSVWHRDDGADVDESTPPSPADWRGEAVLDGERAVARLARQTVALRLSGIYGPGRTWLVDRIAAGALAPPLQAVHGNRIWRDDAANAVVHALKLAQPAPVYVVSDDDPADLREVYAWIAARLGVTLPAPAPGFAGRGGDKRCRSTLLQQSGLQLEAPDYRAGYAQLLNQR